MKNTFEKSLQKTWVVCLLATACCILWGSAFPCIKIGYILFNIASSDTQTQILFAGLRFTIAGILTVIIGSVLQKKILIPKKNAIPKICVIALLQTVIQYFFFYIGLAHTTGVNGSIIESTNVFIAIIVSSLIFKQEILSTQKIIGCIIGFVGVILINTDLGGISFNLLGDGFVLISTTAYAFSSVFNKHYSKTENPVMLSGYQFILGGIVMILGGLAAGGRFTVFNFSCGVLLLYMAFISAIAYSIWSILLKYNDVSKVTVYGFTNPLFGVILSVIILREGKTFDLTSFLSLLFVCVGIFIVNYSKKTDFNFY